MSAPQGLCERTVSGEYWGEGSGRRGFGAWKRDSLVAPAPRSAEVFPSTTASDLRIAQQNPFTESRVVQRVDYKCDVRGRTLFLRVSASWDCQGAPGTESGNALAGDRIQHLSVLCSQFLSLPRRRDTPVLPLHVLMVFPRLCARPRAAWKGSAGALPPGLVRLSIWQRACGPWEGLVARVTPPCLDAGGRENGLARECR